MTASRCGKARRQLHLLVPRHRRALAAALMAAAVACGLVALRPPPPERVSVVAAARDLAGGARLTSRDLTTVDLRPEAVPGGALRQERTATGQTLAGPARAGAALTDARLVGPSLVAADDAVATPVRLADAGVVRLLDAGDRSTSSPPLQAAGSGQPGTHPLRLSPPT